MSEPRFVAPEEALAGKAGVLVYGAGSIGRGVVAALLSRGVPVRAVLDRRAASLPSAAGLAVVAPSQEAPTALRGVPVALAIFNREVDVLSHARELARAGYGPFVSFVALHALLRDELGDRFWLGDRALLDRERSAIEGVRALLADGPSVALFDALLAFRRTGDYARLPRPATGVPYVSADVPGWLSRRPLRLVDGGAYDGDTLEAFRLAGREPDRAACFEPDPESFALLAARVERLGAAGTARLFRCALARATGRLRFAAGGGESSRLDPGGGTEVESVALDDVPLGFAPTLVKLDVEGAEPEALAGMERTLQRERPDLAVAVYHEPDHLWSLPAGIAALGLGYRLFLRLHGENGLETVLYAVA